MEGFYFKIDVMLNSDWHLQEIVFMMYVLDHKVPLRVPDLWQVFYVPVHVVLEGSDTLKWCRSENFV